MAARIVAWTTRMLRRGGSPGAVRLSASAYLNVYRTMLVSVVISQSTFDRRACEHTRKLIIAHARSHGTRIDGFNFRSGMSSGGGSAPWPVHRGVLSRFPPKPCYPSVRVRFPGIFRSETFQAVTSVYKL